MPSSETITTEALIKLAEALEDVRTSLEEAGECFEHGEVFGAAFSHYGLDMAAVFPGAHNFAVRDAKSKAAHIETIQERLITTAANWSEAEGHNTVATEV